MGIGKRLKEAREKSGLTQEELGRKIGVTGSAITNYEKETSHPKEPVMYALMDTLNIEPNYLFQDCVETLKSRKSGLLDLLEAEHIKKYRLLDSHGKEAVDSILDIEYKRILESEKPIKNNDDGKIIRFTVPQYQEPMSAGYGDDIGTAYAENIELIKKPPRGTSFIARVDGDSMEPDFHHGDWVFIHSQTEIPVGKVGVFYMDGKEYIKELGDDELISRNPAYPPRPMTEDVICQGLVLGICGKEYFE